MLNVTIIISDEQEAALTKLGTSAVPTKSAEDYFRDRVGEVLGSYVTEEEKKDFESVEDAFSKAAKETQNEVKEVLGLEPKPGILSPKP